MHGLLQSAGAYCVNDDDSLAFYLCKSGYDVWLGNNRCGFKPKHALLEYSDPRMWCWNIRQMGVFDLPALTSRGALRDGLRQARPRVPLPGNDRNLRGAGKGAAAGPGREDHRLLRAGPGSLRRPAHRQDVLQVHARHQPGHVPPDVRHPRLHPLHDDDVHSLLHPRIYGWLGYKVFSFMFDWTDRRWDPGGSGTAMFQFAPVYVRR